MAIISSSPPARQPDDLRRVRQLLIRQLTALVNQAKHEDLVSLMGFVARWAELAGGSDTGQEPAVVTAAIDVAGSHILSATTRSHPQERNKARKAEDD